MVCLIFVGWLVDRSPIHYRRRRTVLYSTYAMGILFIRPDGDADFYPVVCQGT